MRETAENRRLVGFYIGVQGKYGRHAFFQKEIPWYCHRSQDAWIKFCETSRVEEKVIDIRNGRYRQKCLAERWLILIFELH